MASKSSSSSLSPKGGDKKKPNDSRKEKKTSRKKTKDEKKSEVDEKKSDTSLTPKKSNQKKSEEDEKKSTSSSRRKARPKEKPVVIRTLQLSDTGNEPPSFEGRIDPDEPLPATKFVSWRMERPVALHMAKTGPLAQKPFTVMTLLRDAANKHPNKIAYASMVDGKWVKLTYQHFLNQVLQAAQGFLQLGLQRFNGVGILGHNAVEYLVVHFGVIFAGGVSVPLHVNTSDEFSYNLIETAKCRILVVDSIKQRKHVLEWRKKLPQLKTIIQYGKDSFDNSDDIHTWQEFLKMAYDVDADLIETRTLQQAPNLCCCILQTAGCSGYPRNVMLSHDNLVWGSNTIGRYMSLSDNNGVMVNFVPLSTILGLTVSVNIAIRFGATVYLIPTTRNKAIVLQVLKEIRPTIFFAPSVFYEFVHREIETQFSRAHFMKRMVVNWAMKVGRKAFDDKARRTNPPVGWSLANAILFRKLRMKLGLDACKEFFSVGGFMLDSDIEFYLSIDMPLLLAYGLTEASGSHTCCLPERFRINSVGVGLDGCKTKIEKPDANGVGELCIGGRNVAMGYLDSEELTTKYFMEDGSFRTGDLARKDEEGFLYIVGRKYEVVTLSGGEKISTVPLIKSVMTNLPFVSYAIIVGQGKPYLALLMTIKTEIEAETDMPSDRLTAGAVDWFRKAGFDVKCVRDIVPKANPKLLEKIQMIIDRINAESPHEAHKIKRWTFLSNDFKHTADELSPTLKIRRWIVEKKYAVTIDSLYP